MYLADFVPELSQYTFCMSTVKLLPGRRFLCSHSCSLAIATNQLAIHRFQLAVVIAIAIVFAVIGVEQNIFAGQAARIAVGAGWLLIAMVDVSQGD